MDRYAGKTVIITGGGGDIACATCRRLLQEGANVVLTDLSEKSLEDAAAEMNGLGYGPDRVRTKTGDVRSLDDCLAVAEFTRETFGRVDVMVATAGILRHYPLDVLTEKDWQDVIDINLTGVYHAAKSVVSIMKEQKYGRMVFISSIGGRTGRPGVGANYAAAKAGIVGMTQNIAYELGPWNITVNCVAPGPLKGRMFSSMEPASIEKLKAGTRIQRLGEPEEIAAAIAYLASDEAGWTTGEILDVNGGLQY
ncbi:MAG: SDR family oxidoreductase [Lachnospiraceae bacterium]|nr:SDR family oxidoreductase [Lachnospiraceae bacterium]